MAIRCDITLRERATEEELRALGAALWGWCARRSGAAGLYQRLDNQVLADLIGGRFPSPLQTPPQAESVTRFSVRDAVSRDPAEALVILRRDIPAAAVEDLVVAGTSWNLPALLPRR
jgi:hypothetical protein